MKAISFRTRQNLLLATNLTLTWRLKRFKRLRSWYQNAKRKFVSSKETRLLGGDRKNGEERHRTLQSSKKTVSIEEAEALNDIDS